MDRVAIFVFSSTCEKKRGVFGRIRHHNHFAGLRHPSCQTLADLDANILQRFRALPSRNLKIKLLLFNIHQQKRPGVRPQNLIDLFHDGAKDLIKLK